MSECMHKYKYTFTHIYIPTYMYTHINTHTYSHTYIRHEQITNKILKEISQIFHEMV